MRRWTDGKSWSASRVSGSFLTYREMEGKRGGNGFAPPLAASRGQGKTPDSTRGSDSDLEMAGEDGPDGYRYKPDGLMKQSFSITTSQGNHLHLISYYARSHPTAQGLNNPTSDPNLRHIRPAKGMYPESTVHEQQNIPAVTRAPMVSAPYSTVPHMAGYARSGAPQHPVYVQPGYGWPSQPPMQAPHHAYSNYQPYTSSGAPPSNGHSPLSYSQSAHQPMPQHPAYVQYDRSPIPPGPAENLPPPPPQHQRNPHPNNGMQQYHQNPSPRVAQAIVTAQHQNQARNPSSTPPMSKIDPRLMAPSPLMQNSTRSRSASPLPPRQEPSNGTTAAQGNGASTIPSIGSLMNGSSADKADAQSEVSNRSNSRSPGGTKKEDGPKDIPNDKLSFGEDMRALRVLDRAFRT